MKGFKLSVIMSIVCLTLSCVTAEMVTEPTKKVNFQIYETVKLEIVDEVKTSYSKKGIPMFNGLLKGKLESLGYSIVDDHEDMLLRVDITGFKPGSAMR